ncbi:MAG: IS110 family transposase [Deltaproteobacteria bacterium]|nr:IS110 family transposase [Deltaproteobacteria bacterium]
METSLEANLGIDVAKKKFDVALLRNGKYKHKSFENKPSGFDSLVTWLKQHDVVLVHACLEATGSYGDALAKFLFHAGHIMSVVNPSRIKAFGESELLRTKTDKTDAKLIARFCERMNPAAWQPDPPEIEHLRALGRRRDALICMRTQELNRIGATDSSVNDSIQKVLCFLEKEIDEISKLIKDHINNNPDLKKKRDLLITIPGVGAVTIEAILSEANAFEKFDTIEKVVAYMGLSPKERTSGSSIKGKPSICKMGSARLRKILYMPALSAIQHNPSVNALYKRLKAKSKNGMIIACACMKKLVHIIYGVIKNGIAFNPEHNLKNACI